MVAPTVINIYKNGRKNPAVYLFPNQRVFTINLFDSSIHIVLAAEATYGKSGAGMIIKTPKFTRERL